MFQVEISFWQLPAVAPHPLFVRQLMYARYCDTHDPCISVLHIFADASLRLGSVVHALAFLTQSASYCDPDEGFELESEEPQPHAAPAAANTTIMRRFTSVRLISISISSDVLREKDFITVSGKQVLFAPVSGGHEGLSNITDRDVRLADKSHPP